jgi:hypothetical protein
LSPEGITTDPEKINAVWEWPTMKNKHEISSFLGQYTYDRQFISGFANVTKLLTELREEKQAFQWTPEVEADFHTLKEALCTPLLLLTHSQERYIFDTDASNVGIARVLSQVQDGQE